MHMMFLFLFPLPYLFLIVSFCLKLFGFFPVACIFRTLKVIDDDAFNVFFIGLEIFREQIVGIALISLGFMIHY